MVNDNSDRGKRPMYQTGASLADDQIKRPRGNGLRINDGGTASVNSAMLSFVRASQQQSGSRPSQIPLRAPVSQSAPLQGSGHYCGTGHLTVPLQVLTSQAVMVLPPLQNPAVIDRQWQAAWQVSRQRNMPPIIPANLIPAYLAQLSANGGASVRPSTGTSGRQNTNLSEEATSLRNISNGALANLGSPTMAAVPQVLVSRKPQPKFEHQTDNQRSENHATAPATSIKDTHMLGVPTGTRPIRHQLFPERQNTNITRCTGKCRLRDAPEGPNRISRPTYGQLSLPRPPRPITEQYAAPNRLPSPSISLGTTSAQMRSIFDTNTCWEPEKSQSKNVTAKQVYNPDIKPETISHVQSTSESSDHVSSCANNIYTLGRLTVPSKRPFLNPVDMLKEIKQKCQQEEERMKKVATFEKIKIKCENQCQRETEACATEGKNQGKAKMLANSEEHANLQLVQIKETDLCEKLSQNQIAKSEEQLQSTKKVKTVEEGNPEIMPMSENPELADSFQLKQSEEPAPTENVTQNQAAEVEGVQVKAESTEEDLVVPEAVSETPIKEDREIICLLDD